jgi:hypothetical protein
MGERVTFLRNHAALAHVAYGATAGESVKLNAAQSTRRAAVCAVGAPSAIGGRAVRSLEEPNFQRQPGQQVCSSNPEP